MRFGENLKEIRKIKKISQEKLAQMLGVSRQSVSKWECGDAYPEMKHILALCELFNCNINDLVHNDMSDLQLMDEDVQQSVVKFKREKQASIQFICKVIQIVANIWKICSLISIPLAILLMCGLPIWMSSLDMNELMAELKFNAFLNIREELQVIVLEGFILFGLIEIVLGYKISKIVIKLCQNISQSSTPFTLKNVDSIKKLSQHLIIFILLDIVMTVLLDSVEASKFVPSISVLPILFILFLLLISHLFEYGYEIQLDSKNQMLGETSNEEETTTTKVFEYLNKNLFPFINKTGWIAVGVAVIYGVFLISSAIYEGIMNYEPENLIQQPIILQLEELGYDETVVSQATLGEDEDCRYYTLIMDSSSQNYIPVDSYLGLELVIYDYETPEKAKTMLLSSMTSTTKWTMTYISSNQLEFSDLDHIRKENITDYVIHLDTEKWKADEAYALFDDETYNHNQNPTQHIYLLKGNRLLILQYDPYLSFSDEQINVLNQLIERSNEIFK